MAVPEIYSGPVETSAALAFDVRMGFGDETTVYVERSGPFTAETQLARLLPSLDIFPGSFADLHGTEVPLARVDGRYVLDLPSGTNVTD